MAESTRPDHAGWSSAREQLLGHLAHRRARGQTLFRRDALARATAMDGASVQAVMADLGSERPDAVRRTDLTGEPRWMIRALLR